MTLLTDADADVAYSERASRLAVHARRLETLHNSSGQQPANREYMRPQSVNPNRWGRGDPSGSSRDQPGSSHDQQGSNHDDRSRSAARPVGMPKVSATQVPLAHSCRYHSYILYGVVSVRNRCASSLAAQPGSKYLGGQPSVEGLRSQRMFPINILLISWEILPTPRKHIQTHT